MLVQERLIKLKTRCEVISWHAAQRDGKCERKGELRGTRGVTGV